MDPQNEEGMGRPPEEGESGTGPEEEEGKGAFAEVHEQVETSRVWHDRIAEVEEKVRRRKEGQEMAAEARDADEGEEWAPPPEAGPQVRIGRFWLRLLAVALLLFVIWGGFQFSTRVLFVPELAAVRAEVPQERLEPGSDVQLGIVTRNDGRFVEGPAYVVMVHPDGTEEQGPVVRVPARDTTLVPISATFPPGDHVVTLILYDAWRTNGRTETFPGLLVRIGEPSVDFTAAELPARATRGDTVEISITAVNNTPRNESVIPVVAIRRATAEAPIEVEGPVLGISGEETASFSVQIGTASLEAGAYVLAVVPVSPRGEPLGQGVHGLPLRIR